MLNLSLIYCSLCSGMTAHFAQDYTAHFHWDSGAHFDGILQVIHPNLNTLKFIKILLGIKKLMFSAQLLPISNRQIAKLKQ